MRYGVPARSDLGRDNHLAFAGRESARIEGLGAVQFVRHLQVLVTTERLPIQANSSRRMPTLN